jgi:hypothetical protein
MKTIIHVNQHIIKANAKGEDIQPPLTIKTYKENRKGFEALISGSAKVIYSPDKPLACGAKVWIETESDVVVL